MDSDAPPAGGLAEALANVSRTCVCLHARMAARAVSRAYDAALRPLGLESAQFALLAAIHADPGRSVSQLAGRLAIERSALSRNLALLEKRGLVTAEAVGRAVRHRVTGEGERLLEAALPRWSEVQARFEAALDGAGGWAGTRRSLRRLRHLAEGAAEVHLPDPPGAGRI